MDLQSWILATLALEAALLLLLEKWMGKKQVTVDNRISDVTQEADTLPVNPDTLVLRMAVVTNPGNQPGNTKLGSYSQLQQEDQSRCNVAQERPIEISKTTSSLTRFPRFEPQTMKVNAVTSNPKGPNDKSLNEVTLK
ncbi:Protein of unknown function [Gryllus bimaculatus]|nr:Protein of unknown function [Gryllus bimaculatus]